MTVAVIQVVAAVATVVTVWRVAAAHQEELGLVLGLADAAAAPAVDAAMRGATDSAVVAVSAEPLAKVSVASCSAAQQSVSSEYQGPCHVCGDMGCRGAGALTEVAAR